MSELAEAIAWASRTPPPEEAGLSEPVRSVWDWATVESLSPLRVRLDGSRAHLPAESLVSGLRLQSRVWVQLVGSTVVVHGKTPDDTGWEASPVTMRTGWAPPRQLSGGTPFGILRQGIWIYVNFQTANPDAITFGADSNIGDQQIGDIAAGWRPDNDAPVLITHNGVKQAFGRLGPNGIILLTHGVPNVTIGAGSSINVWAFYPGTLGN